MRAIRDFQFGVGMLNAKLPRARGAFEPKPSRNYQPDPDLSIEFYDADNPKWMFGFQGEELCEGAEDIGSDFCAQFETAHGYLLLASLMANLDDTFLVVSYLSRDFKLLDRAVMTYFWLPKNSLCQELFDLETGLLHREHNVIDSWECGPGERLRIRLKTEMTYEIKVFDPPRRSRTSWLLVDRLGTSWWNRRYLTVRWANPWLPFQQAGRDMIADWKARVRKWKAKGAD